MNQIQKNARDIDSRLKIIETANLFKPPVLKNVDLPSCKVCDLKFVTLYYFRF